MPNVQRHSRIFVTCDFLVHRRGTAHGHRMDWVYKELGTVIFLFDLHLMGLSFHNPPELFNSRPYGFSQLVTSGFSGTLFCSAGQVAMDANEQIVGSTLEEQTRMALQNLEWVLKSGGARLSDVMSLRIYIVQSQQHQIQDVGQVLREIYGTDHPPATTWIGVSFLARPGMLVEIEATGVIQTGT